MDPQNWINYQQWNSLYAHRGKMPKSLTSEASQSVCTVPFLVVIFVFPCNQQTHGKQTYLNSSLRKVVPFLDHRCQFTDASALLTQNILRSGGQNDDLRAGGSHSHLNTAVAILGQLTGEELVQLSLEQTVLHKLQHSCQNQVSACMDNYSQVM